MLLSRLCLPIVPNHATAFQKKLNDRSEDIGFHDFDPNWAQMVHLFHKKTFWENLTVLLLSTYCGQ